MRNPRSTLAAALTLATLLTSLGCARVVEVEPEQWSALNRWPEARHIELDASDGERLVVEARHTPRVRLEVQGQDAPIVSDLASLRVGDDGALQVEGQLERSRLVPASNPTQHYDLRSDEVKSLQLELSGYAPPDWEPLFALGISAGGPALFASLDVTWYATPWALVDFGLGNIFGPTGVASPYAGARFVLYNGTLRPWIGAALVQHLFFGAMDDRPAGNGPQYSGDALTTIVPRLGVDLPLYNGRFLVGVEADANIVALTTLRRSEETFLTRREGLNPWGGVRAQWVW